MAYERLCVEKCFERVAIEDLDHLNQQEVPEDWLEQLIQRCKDVLEDLPSFEDEFRNQLALSLDEEPQVLDKLKLIYKWVFHVKDQSEVEAMIRFFDDRSKGCHDGLRNRINAIINSFKVPYNIPAMLTMLRQHYVEMTARKNGDGTHLINQFTVVAEVPFGVFPVRYDDPHRGDVEVIHIREQLDEQFAKRYTLHHLFANVVDQIRAQLYVNFQYKGYNASSYVIKQFDVFKYFLEKFINPNHFPPNDQLFCFDEWYQVVDLNWVSIRRALLLTLIEEGYFILLPEERACIERLLQIQISVSDLAPGDLSALFQNDFIKSVLGLAVLISCIDPSHRTLQFALIDAYLQRFEDDFMQLSQFLCMSRLLRSLEHYHPLLESYQSKLSSDITGRLLSVKGEANQSTFMALVAGNDVKLQSNLKRFARLPSHAKFLVLSHINDAQENVLMKTVVSLPNLLSPLLETMHDLSSGQKYRILKQQSCHKDSIFSLAFNRHNHLIATLMKFSAPLKAHHKLRLLIQMTASGPTIAHVNRHLASMQFISNVDEVNLIIQLSRLQEKVSRFKTRSDRSCLTGPYQIAKTLIATLESCFLTYLQSDKSIVRRMQLGEEWNTAINNAHPVLSEHQENAEIAADVAAKIAYSLTVFGFFKMTCVDGFSKPLIKTETQSVMEGLQRGAQQIIRGRQAFAGS